MDALRPLSLDQFAAMTAEMEAGFPRDRVLEAAAVSQEQWDLTQETWLLRMAKQGQQRKLALLDRYNELLAKHRKAAHRKMRAEKRKLRGPMPVAPEAYLSPLAPSRVDDGGATFQKPSFSDGSAPFVTPAPAAGVVVPAVPQVVSAPAVVAAAPAPEEDDDVGVTTVGAVVAAGPAWLQAAVAQASTEPPGDITTSGEPSPLAGAAPAWLKPKAPARSDAPKPPAPPPSNRGLPATAGPAWLQSSASFPAITAPAPPPAATASTGGLPFQRPQANAPQTASPAAPARDGLPFQKRSPSQPGINTLPAPADGLPFQKRSPSQPGITTLPAQADGLPFQRAQAASQPPAAPATPTGGLPFQRPQAPAQPQKAAPAPHAPASAQAHAPAPRLSLEQLAWLQAQVEVSAELGRAAREKLGLGEAEYAAEKAFWQGRFQQDRAAVERYSQLFYHYKRAR